MQLIGAEPPQAVSLEEFKRATHFIEGDANDDAALGGYLLAAQSFVETASGRPLGVRSVRFTVAPIMGLRRWWFPVAPVGAITSVKVFDDGVERLVDPADYRLAFGEDEPQLRFGAGVIGAESEMIAIEAAVGSPDGGLYLGLKQAILMIAKDWFEAGIAVDAVDASRLVISARTLIGQVKYTRPKIWGAL